MSWVSKARSGFTLIEVVIAMTLVGLIGVGLSSGLVYAVKVYRSADAVAQTPPQVDAAVNVITRLIRQEGSGYTDRLSYDKAAGALLLDGVRLLGQVGGFSVTQQKAFASGRATLYRVSLTVAFDRTAATERTFVFYVNPIYPSV